MLKIPAILSLCYLLTAPLVSGKASCETAWTSGTNPLMSINLLSFDSATGDLHALLILMLPKSEITPQFAPRHDFYLIDELTSGESVLKIDSSKPYSIFNNHHPADYRVDDAGSQFFYPFDVHHAEIDAFVDRSVSGKSPEILQEHLPVSIDTSLCSFEGYKIKVTPGPENSPNYVDMHIEIKRTLPIRFFTMFVSVLMLLVALGFMKMVLKLARSHSPPDINEMAFGAALLFAFPAIRNIEPFVPPMGVLSDFVGFFWAESIVAVALIIHLICWMKRKTHD